MGVTDCPSCADLTAQLASVEKERDRLLESICPGDSFLEKLATMEQERDVLIEQEKLQANSVTTAQARVTALNKAIEKFLLDTSVVPPWESAGAIWALRIKELQMKWLDAKAYQALDGKVDDRLTAVDRGRAAGPLTRSRG